MPQQLVFLEKTITDYFSQLVTHTHINVLSAQCRTKQLTGFLPYFILELCLIAAFRLALLFNVVSGPFSFNYVVLLLISSH